MPTNIQTVTQNLRHNQSINSEHAHIFLFILHESHIFCLSHMNGKKLGVRKDHFCW